MRNVPLSTVSRPNVYSYSDYRTFLADLYLYLKETNPSFSHQSVARKTGSTPSYLKHVIKRRKHMSVDRVGRVADALGLQEEETEYFAILLMRDTVRDARTRKCLENILLKLLPGNADQ